jgi:hypothetical protein
LRLSHGTVEPIKEPNIGSIAMKAVILLLVVLCLVPSACARDYILEGATTNITVDPSGIAAR